MATSISPAFGGGIKLGESIWKSFTSVERFGMNSTREISIKQKFDGGETTNIFKFQPFGSSSWSNKYNYLCKYQNLTDETEYIVIEGAFKFSTNGNYANQYDGAVYWRETAEGQAYDMHLVNIGVLLIRDILAPNEKIVIACTNNGKFLCVGSNLGFQISPYYYDETENGFTGIFNNPDYKGGGDLYGNTNYCPVCTRTIS